MFVHVVPHDFSSVFVWTHRYTLLCTSGSQPSYCCGPLIQVRMLCQPPAIMLFHCYCNLTTVMNYHVNIWYVTPVTWSLDPLPSEGLPLPLYLSWHLRSPASVDLEWFSLSAAPEAPLPLTVAGFYCYCGHSGLVKPFSVIWLVYVTSNLSASCPNWINTRSATLPFSP